MSTNIYLFAVAGITEEMLVKYLAQELVWKEIYYGHETLDVWGLKSWDTDTMVWGEGKHKVTTQIGADAIHIGSYERYAPRLRALLHKSEGRCPFMLITEDSIRLVLKNYGIYEGDVMGATTVTHTELEQWLRARIGLRLCLRCD